MMAERSVEQQPVEKRPFGFSQEDWDDFARARLDGAPDDEDLRIIGELSKLPKDPFLANHNTFGYSHIDGEQLISQLKRQSESKRAQCGNAINEREGFRFEASAEYYRLMASFVEKRGRHAANHLNGLFERRKRPKNE